MLDKSVLPVHAHVLYSNPHSLTKQMAATSISCSDFKKTIDSMFSKLRRSTSPLLEKLEDAPRFDMDFALDLTMCSADFICMNGSTIQ